MHGCCLYKYRPDRNTILGLKLLLVWYAGLSLGYLAARFFGGTLVSFFRQAVFCHSSLLDHLWVSVFPLLFSACAVSLFQSHISWLVCLVRALGIGFSAGGLVISYGTAGCMMVVLLLFSAVCCAPAELWFLWRRICADGVGPGRDLLVCVWLCVGIGFLDYFVISPFLADIFIF